MTEPIATNETPTDVGRNDPCPCGSEKKYKKCCMNADRIQKEATKSSRAPHELIGEHTSPWDLYKLLVSATENNMPKFFWEAAHELGPWRQRYTTPEQYFVALGDGSDNMVARAGSDLLRIRHDDPDVLLLLRRGDVAEVVTLRTHELDAAGDTRDVDHWGYRVWDVTRVDIPKGTDDITFSALGVAWRRA